MKIFFSRIITLLLLIPPSNFIEDYMYIEYIFLTIIFLYMIVGLKKIDHG